MPGLKIIEVILGLTFVYLLLSLLCTAINEYVAGILNKRGRELFKAINQLIGNPAVRKEFYSHPLISTLSPPGKRLTWRLFGWLLPKMRPHRLPSYLPARNFALALLDAKNKAGQDTAAGDQLGSASAGGDQSLAKLDQLFQALRQQSAADVSELLRDPSVALILGSANVPPGVSTELTQVVTGAQAELHKLQDAVEVWFNNAMDRVSGTYKRYTQVALLLIGFVAASLMNVDTIRIWRTLSTNDELRQALVRRAIAFDATVNDTSRTDTTKQGTAPPPPPAGQVSAPADTTCSAVTGEAAQKALAKARADQRLTCGEARAVWGIARAQLDSTQLALGWTPNELMEIGVAKRNADGKLIPLVSPRYWHIAIWPKLLGLLLTAIAVSLGAPFWFDMLNKIVNIRGAGRAPDERSKNPEAPGKRLAEVSPK